MAKHNKVFFNGRVANPDFKVFDSGSKKFSFSLAIDDSYKPEGKDWINKTIWMDVELWGKQADSWQTLEKGQELLIEGRLKQDEYEKDGQKRRRTYISPEKITPIDKVKKQSTQQNSEFSEYDQALNSAYDLGVESAEHKLIIMKDSNGNKMRNTDGDYIVLNSETGEEIERLPF
jgi:single stranded DNA-binding protein